MRIQQQGPALLASAAFLSGCSGGGGDASPPTNAIGGAVSGLAGSGLVLSLNGGSDVAVGANGTFIFPVGLTNGTAYTVSIKTQPATPYQTCVITNATGTMGSAAIANVGVACTTKNFVVRGTVEGLTGSGLALRLGTSPQLTVAADGAFEFPGQLASGSSYNVTVSRQPLSPFQTCVAANPTGVIGDGDTDITVTCTLDTFSVSGTVTGLTGLGLVLQLNGEQDLPINGDGTFVFPDRLLRGTQYAVTIASQTSTYRELCGLGSASGTGGAANVTNVKVACGVVSGFVYRGDNAGAIVKFGVHPTTGAMLPLGREVEAGDSIVRLVVAPNREMLYAVGAGTVRALSIDSSTGNLSAVGVPVATGANALADHTVVHPSGLFLYVFNINLGTVALVSADPVTGVLRFERNVATSVAASSYASRDHLAISPNGSYLYVLNYAYGDPTPPSVTTYAIDSATGSLTSVATVDTQDSRSLTMDPLGRFLFLRNTTVAGNVAWADTAVYPYSIDPATGAVTANNVTTTVLGNSGSDMIVDPSGRYAYLVGSFNYVPEDRRIDAFAIDPTSGDLTANGPGVVTPGSVRQVAIDSGGRFVFAANVKPAGTYDASQVWCDGSTFTIGGAGPTEGQISGPGNACSIGSTDTWVIALVE